MSVYEAVELPAQPSSGSSTYEGKGGNGLVAPMAAYYLNSFAVTGDATGGVAQVNVTCDPRYESMLAFIASKATGGTIGAAVDCRLQVTYDSFGWATHKTGGYSAIDSASRLSWSLDPAISFGITDFQVRFANVDAATFTLDAIVYVFKKNVQQLVPLPQLLASLPRGITCL